MAPIYTSVCVTSSSVFWYTPKNFSSYFTTYCLHSRLIHTVNRKFSSVNNNNARQPSPSYKSHLPLIFSSPHSLIFPLTSLL